MDKHSYSTNRGKICLSRRLLRVTLSSREVITVHHRFIPYPLFRVMKNPAQATNRCIFVIMMIASRQNYNNRTQGSPVRSFADAVSFHGHACPGLAIGYRAAVYALETLRGGRDVDEELVAIVENDACGSMQYRW